MVPYVETYPYLLPKSYLNANDSHNYKEGFKDELFKCNIQVFKNEVFSPI